MTKSSQWNVIKMRISFILRILETKRFPLVISFFSVSVILKFYILFPEENEGKMELLEAICRFIILKVVHVEIFFLIFSVIYKNIHFI